MSTLLLLSIAVESGVAGIISASGSQTVTEGTPVKFEMTAEGEMPLTYQWARDYSSFSTNVTLFATNCVLDMGNASTNIAGFYRTIVIDGNGINSYGPLFYLTVIKPAMGTNGFTITLNGITSQVFRVEYATNYLSGEWTTLTNIVITSRNGVRFVDTQSTNESRFYRVIPPY